MMKFTLLAIALLAVTTVQSKKYYGGCVGSLCGGGLGYGIGGVALGAPAVAVAAPVAHVAVAAAPALAVGYGGLGYGLGGGCIDTLSGCGGFATAGYCGQAYYSRGCCNTCGIYKKK